MKAPFAATLAWADWGLTILVEQVSEQSGPNATSKVITNDRALIPDLTDLDKFITEFGKEKIESFVNGTSLRVIAQRVNRQNAKKPDAEVEQALLNAIRGVRAAATRTVTVVKMSLPDNTFYTGSDEAEYQAAYAAALVDLGVEAEKALAIAETLTLGK